ncbi:MAG: 16S rRNA (cytosine(967)-C(5))-methyltransferase RsmB [Bacillota bacterium]|jgi:16S rRNA (cytosine967-C5)-methyltransferase
MPRLSARELALKALVAVEADGAYANLALNSILEKYKPGKLDRAFTTELVYGSLRARNTLDWALGRLLRHSLDRQTPQVRSILRLSAYQIMFMDRVPDSAAVNEGAELARKYGHPGAVKFVNGVLRNLVRQKGELKYPDQAEDPVGYLALVYSYPRWLVQRWLQQLGHSETVDLCRAGNEPAPNTVRTNTLKTTRGDLQARLQQEGVVAQPTKYAPEGLELQGFLSIGAIPSFQEGLFQVQDESSMLAGHAVSPEPGSLVIDAASAPGGKTTHLAQLMNNQGRIIAYDVHAHKLKLVEDNCQRLGVNIVETRLGDASNLPLELTARADYVLLDAPCSGLGVLRRRPDARWRKEPGQIEELVSLQQRLLTGSARCVRPGGVLVYSTCTVMEEENINQWRAFLLHNPWFEPEDLGPYLPARLDCGGTMAAGYVQLLPGRHGTDGFFIARMRRKRE